MSKLHFVHNANKNLYIGLDETMCSNALHSVLKQIHAALPRDNPSLQDEVCELAEKAVLNLNAYAQNFIYHYPRENPFITGDVLEHGEFQKDRDATVAKSNVCLTSARLFRHKKDIPTLLRTKKLELRLVQPDPEVFAVSFLRNIPHENVRMLQIDFYTPHPKQSKTMPKNTAKPDVPPPEVEKAVKSVGNPIPDEILPGHVYLDESGTAWMNVTSMTFLMRRVFANKYPQDPTPLPAPEKWRIVPRPGEYAYLRWTSNMRTSLDKLTNPTGRPTQNHILRIMAKRSLQPWTGTTNWCQTAQPKRFKRDMGQVIPEISAEPEIIQSSKHYDPEVNCLVGYEFMLTKNNDLSGVDPNTLVDPNEFKSIREACAINTGNVKAIFRQEPKEASET